MSIILEQLAQARAQMAWKACMAPALAQLNCRVIQSTSEEAPGLLAYVAHYLDSIGIPILRLPSRPRSSRARRVGDCSQ